MSYKTILLEIEDGIATITYNRPKVFNAYNAEMSAELRDAVTKLGEDTSVRVLIIRGSGENHMAGADINMLNFWTKLAEEKGVEAVKDDLDHHFTPNLLEALPFPVIAVIDGYCFGMGMEIAMGCDYRFATNRAVFCQPEITVGIITGGGASQRLPRLIGRPRASEMIMTGNQYTAQQLYDWGWLNAITEPEKLDETVGKLIKGIKSKSPLMIKLAKETIVKSMNTGLYEGVEFELKTFASVFASDDAKEGTAAFLERRKPNFTGK